MRTPTSDEQSTPASPSVPILDRAGPAGTPRRVGVVAFVGYAGLALAGILIAAAVESADGWLFDESGFMTRLSADRSPIAVDAAAFFSAFSHTPTVIGTAAGAVIVLALTRLTRQIIVLAVALGVELATFLTITYVVARPRPSVDATVPFPVTPSFPSGHVAAAVALYGGLAIVVWSLDRTRSVRVATALVAVVVPSMVAVSRVYQGLHYPTDVAAGACMGAGCLVVGVRAAGIRAATARTPDATVSTRGPEEPLQVDAGPEFVRVGPFTTHIPRPSHVLLRSRALVGATAASGIGLGLVAALRQEWLLTIDEPVTRAIRGESLIGFFRFWTELGSQQNMLVAAAGLGVLLWPTCRPFAVALPAALIAGVVVDVTLKIAVDRPRPPNPLVGTALGSFPSGHAVTGVIFFGLLPPAVWIALRRRLLFWISVSLSVIVAILVALSRVYLGGHWPSDVVASALLGAGILLGTEWLLGTRFAQHYCDGCPLHVDRSN